MADAKPYIPGATGTGGGEGVGLRLKQLGTATPSFSSTANQYAITTFDLPSEILNTEIWALHLGDEAEQGNNLIFFRPGNTDGIPDNNVQTGDVASATNGFRIDLTEDTSSTDNVGHIWLAWGTGDVLFIAPSSTEIGVGTMTFYQVVPGVDDFARALSLNLDNSNNLSVSLTRDGGTPLSSSVDLSDLTANDFVNDAEFTLSGTTLTATLTRDSGETIDADVDLAPLQDGNDNDFVNDANFSLSSSNVLQLTLTRDSGDTVVGDVDLSSLEEGDIDGLTAVLTNGTELVITISRVGTSNVIGSVDLSSIAGSGGGSGIVSVVSDDTLSGDGTTGDPLAVANPFTDDDETKLDGIETGATADQTAPEIVALLQALVGNDRLDASAIKNLPTGNVGRNLVLLATKTSGNAVSATTITEIEVAWLSAAGAVATDYDEIIIEAEYGNDFAYGLMPRARSMVNNKTYALLTTDAHFFPRFEIQFDSTNPRRVQVRLQAASAQTSGTLRVYGINYQRVTGDGAGSGSGTVSTDATISGDGSQSDPLSVANPFTDADETKLDGIETAATADQTASEIKTAYESNDNTNAFTDAEQTKLGGVEDNATADQTASEIVSAIEGETGNDRLDAQSLRNFPDATILQKGYVELATAAEAAARTDNERAVTPSSLPLATATQEGLVELASNAEADAGTDTSKVMTPAAVVRQLGPQISSAEISTGTETAIRRYSPADIVAIVTAHEEEGLSQSEVDARVRALVVNLALQGNSDRWPKNKLPTDLVDTAALTTAVADFVAANTITTERTAAINAAINALEAITDGGTWAAGTAYAVRVVVRHEGATYLSITTVGANTEAVTEPGTGTDWETHWDRLGYEDGPPNAIVGVSRDDRTLTFTRESGENPLELTLPAGGESAYSFHARPTLSYTDLPLHDDEDTLPADRTIPNDDNGFVITLLDQEVIDGPIQSDNDFITDWTGGFTIRLHANRHIETVMRTTHSFNGKTIVHNRIGEWKGLVDNEMVYFNLNAFDSRSRVSVGAYTRSDGTTVEITEEDLKGSVTLTYELLLHCWNNSGTARQAGAIESLTWNSPTVTSFQLGAFEQLVESATRAESIGFSNLASSQANTELLSDVSAATVVHGSGEPEIITGVTSGSGDFTVKSGAYLAELSGEFQGSGDNARATFLIRNSSDDTAITHAAGVITPDSLGTIPASLKELLFLENDTEVNVQVTRDGSNVQINNPLLTLVPLGGEKGDKGDDAPGTFSPTDLGTTTFDLDGNAAQVALMNSGSAIVCPADGYIIAIINVPTLGLVGSMSWMLASDLRDAASDSALVAGLYTNSSNEIFFHAGSQDGGSSTGNEIIIQHIGTTTDETGTGTTILPSILRFNVTGDAMPTAGSIAGDSYNFNLAISQTAEVGAARIVGFAGGPVANPSTVAVLHTVPTTSYHSDSGSVTIPAGVTLTTGAQYTIRLEVYPTGSPTTGAPTIYHDYVITAQAVAAQVHFGLVLYNSADTTAAQRAARIVFADDDLSTTSSAAGSWTMSGIPDDGTEYLPYWAVPESLDQPVAWTQSSFPITNFIEQPVQRDIGSVTYNIYMYVADSRVDSAGNNSIIVTTV